MELYIHSSGILSAAGNNSEEKFLQLPPDHPGDMLLCKEPDYTAYIPAMQLRRMSKAVRMGIGASKIALQNAGIEKPDALSVGTALGCLNDTEVFLSKMTDQDEQMLTPTAFIQSTHNTVAGQIALLCGCNGHNLTYVHKGHSFEHAMINAQLYLKEHQDSNILVGGIDELTLTTAKVLKRFGSNKNAEGAAFFVVSDKPDREHSICIRDIQTFTAKNEAEEIKREVSNFLSRNEWNASDVDCILLGLNGETENDAAYQRLQQDLMPDTAQVWFKNYCGEYPTASAFALGLLAEAVTKGFPEHGIANFPAKKLQNIMIVNNYFDSWSVWSVVVSG
ncbi:MAG TPA: beta-ketoacyl synthase chain length factor [Flavipsychrobacter sp.]|nr:beta-ketoacyl synthase chain length factor [Flavipsychrobacter sp.]